VSILHRAKINGLLGPRGERLYGKRNFFELYAVFTAPPVLRVLHGRDEVGTVQSYFVSMHDREKGPLCFRLSGRSWEVAHVDWGKGVVKVSPAKGGRAPSWIGMPGVLSTTLCMAMQEVLLHPGPEASWLSEAAARTLEELRQGYDGLLAEGTAPMEDDGETIRWHTFAGGAVNRLLAAGLELLTGKRWIAGNLSIHCKGADLTEATEAARSLPGLEWEKVASVAAHAMARGMVSKFQPCLPEDAEDRLLAEKLLDIGGTLRFLAMTSINGTRPATRPAGFRLVDGEALPEIHVEPLPTITEGGRHEPKASIRWIDSPIALRTAADELRSAEVVGLDVETALDFGTLCLVQVATNATIYLIDPFTVGDLEPLREALASAKPVKVIHNARFEARVLAGVGLQLGGVFDTLDASRRLRGRDALGGHSLATVCERELGFTLDKSAQTSNWTRRPLSSEQLRYAAADAEVLLALFERLK
jgi:ATP-dependent Lhr-like helicase